MISRITAALAVLAVLLACGQASTPVTQDKYYGPIDGSALDSKLRSVAASTGRCPTGQAPCYPVQQVSIHGATVPIYNMGVVTSGLTFGAGGTLSGSTFVSSSIYAYSFPDQCLPDLSYDPFNDPYPNDHQYPVFSGLPLSPASSSAVVLPVVRVAGVNGLQDDPCNALKKTASIEAGNFGAAPDDPKTASTVRLWAVIDPAAWVIPLSATSAFAPEYGWFKGLILSWLDGGRVPLNAAGNVLTMEGVIVDPATGSASATTANKVIILPFGPDESGYSPIIRLRRFKAAASTQPSAYTALCTTATPTGGLPPCTGAPNEVNMASSSVLASTETLIAVTSSL